MPPIRRAVRLLLTAILLSIAPVSNAQLQTKFSGTWVDQESGKNAARSIMTVKQSNDPIEITEEWQGKTYINTFPMNGSAGTYRNVRGIAGTGSAKWKGNDLLIETFVTSPPIDGKTMRFHEKQRWQLSKNGTVLKVRTETDSPDMPAEITSAAIPTTTEIYKRSAP